MSGNGSNTKEEVSPKQFRDLKRQLRQQSKQITSLVDLVSQVITQVLRIEGRVGDKKPKMSPPKKYGEGRDELQTFLISIKLYYAYYRDPIDQEKIYIVGLFIKGKVAIQIQPYLKDYLANRSTSGTKTATRILFASQEGFQLQI